LSYGLGKGKRLMIYQILERDGGVRVIRWTIWVFSQEVKSVQSSTKGFLNLLNNIFYNCRGWRWFHWYNTCDGHRCRTFRRSVVIPLWKTVCSLGSSRRSNGRGWGWEWEWRSAAIIHLNIAVFTWNLEACQGGSTPRLPEISQILA
jgi:hypothetical protein